MSALPNAEWCPIDHEHLLHYYEVTESGAHIVHHDAFGRHLSKESLEHLRVVGGRT